MSNELISESERLQMEQIRDLESEILQVEEVEESSDDEELSGSRDEGGFTYLTSILVDTEVTDTHDRLPSTNGGSTILNLPMFYLEGIVLFPEAVLPLTIIQPRFIAAALKAMNRVDSACTIGVVCVYKRLNDTTLRFATIGTTAEIRQNRELEDGSLDVVTHGQQRFHLQHRWIDAEGVPWAAVQIIQEDKPLQIPKDAFGQLASVSNIRNRGYSHAILSAAALTKRQEYKDDENEWEHSSNTNTDSDYSMADMEVPRCSSDSCDEYGSTDESMSSDNELMCGLGHMSRKSQPCNSESECHPHIHDKMSESDDRSGLGSAKVSVQGRESVREWNKAAAEKSKWLHRAPRSFWPQWVYRMYDPYSLAWRLADLWNEILGDTDIYSVVNKPDILSFHIARQIPVPVATRQELLDIDGVTYRLRKEIELLEHYNLICCKTCLAVIAKHTDMMDKTGNGPLSQYAQVHGYVHEIMILDNANGLTLIGSPIEEPKWFPGYAWVSAACVKCESKLGWFFTATDKKLQLKSFWGIRYSQLADTW